MLDQPSTIPGLLFRAVASFTDQPALIFTRDKVREEWSYSELQRRACHAAQRLSLRGIAQGDRVSIWAPNSPEWVAAFFGALMIGAVVVPLDVRSGTDFIERVLGSAAPKALITTPDLLSSIRPTSVDIVPMDSLSGVSELADVILPTILPTDLAELVFTSGTTGSPKGVMLTHGNILSDLYAACTIIHPESRYRMLSLLPLSHMLGQIAELFFALSAGARVIYVESLQPATIFAAMRTEGVNGLAVVPTILGLFMSGIEREVRKRKAETSWKRAHALARFLPFPLRRYLFKTIHERFGGKLEFVISGGAYLDPALAQKWENMGIKIAVGYGMTEAAPIVALNSLEHRNRRSIGRALPCCDVTIDSNGELLVKGPNIMLGYWHNEEATALAFEDGWYKTGDLCTIDNKGFLYLRGRIKNIIVLPSGLNVYPEDIENILMEHPAVDQAVVLGRTNGSDIDVHAVIIPLHDLADTLDISALIKATNDRLAVHQKIKNWTVWPTDIPLPQTHTMKPKRIDILRMLDEGF